MTPALVLKVFWGVFVLVFVDIMLWDWRLYVDDTPRNSITQATIDYSKKHPILPWFWGLIMGALSGHFYL